MNSHTAISHVDIVSGPTVLRTLEVIGGSVTVDGKNDVRRRVSVTLSDPTLVPEDLTSLVAPGHEMKPYRGIRFTDGTEEVYPLGVFGISTTSVSDTPQGLTISVDGYDRARKVQRAGFPAPYVITAGSNYAIAIKEFIKSKIPGVLADSDYIFTPTSLTTPQLIFGVGNGDDPWKFARDMAEAIGMELFFDAYGKCVLRTATSGQPQIIYTEGEDAIILSVEKAITDEDTWNHIIVIGNNSTATGAPVRAEAWDSDPASPTYRYGSFGDVPFPTYVNPYITSYDHAQLIANLLLAAVLGYGETVSFSIIPNPIHEANDSIGLVRSNSKINATYAIESFTVPLDARSAMTVVCKKRRVV